MSAVFLVGRILFAAMFLLERCGRVSSRAGFVAGGG